MDKIGQLSSLCRSFVSGVAAPEGSDNVQEWLRRARTSRKLVLIIVFVALFLDNMLLTTVVPVIPNLLTLHDFPDAYATHPDINITRLSYEEQTDPEMRRLFKETCKSKVNIRKMYDNITGIIWGMSYLPEVRASINVPTCFSPENFSETITAVYKERRHKALVNETVKVGVMFASKAVVQLMTNPIIGPLTNRIGYTIPMFTGFVILTVSTTVFAFATNYFVLFFARALQGIGSACSSTAGMGMLASRYPDDAERGQALGFALGGLALGVLVGPPFGGFMYEFVGKEAPFLILAALAVADGALQLILLNPCVKPEEQQGTPLLTLLRDPYILITTGAIMLGNLGIAMLEPTLPIWMLDTMSASKFQQGAAFLPASISYLIGTFIFGRMAHIMGRWRTGLIGMLIVAFALFVIPFSTQTYHLIFPNFCLGFAIGMVDSSMMPTMGHLVDLRYVSVYGTVYAIADVAFCLGFAVGPALSGNLVKSIGFDWMLWSIAIINIVFSPLFIFLRNPPPKDSYQDPITDGSGTKYCADGAVYEQLDNTEDPDYGTDLTQNHSVNIEQTSYGTMDASSNDQPNPFGANMPSNTPKPLQQSSGYGY